MDECQTNPCGPEKNNTCKNFQGYYKCECGKGFSLDGEEMSCTGMQKNLIS